MNGFRLTLPLWLTLVACDAESEQSTGEQASAALPSPSAPASEQAPPAPAQSASAGSQKRPPPFEGTAGIVDRQSNGTVAMLREVRTARHDGFDRVVFEFAGAGLPGYHLEYVDKPVRKCGSGEPTTIAGDGWLEVRLHPAAAHDEAGSPTVDERERSLQLPIVREVELTCDFEAVVTWVLGTASPNRYRVLELTDPPRLAVDVKHGR